MSDRLRGDHVEHRDCRDAIVHTLSVFGTGARVALLKEHECEWWEPVVCPHGVTLWLHPDRR